MKRKVTKARKGPVRKDLYGAVDLHGDNGLYCLINERDERVFQQRLPKELKTVLQALEPYKERLVGGVAVESTFNWSKWCACRRRKTNLLPH